MSLKRLTKELLSRDIQVLSPLVLPSPGLDTVEALLAALLEIPTPEFLWL